MRRRNRPMSSRRCDRRASTWKVEPLRSLPPSSAAISKSGRASPLRPDSSGSIGSGVWGGQRRAHRNRLLPISTHFECRSRASQTSVRRTHLVEISVRSTARWASVCPPPMPRNEKARQRRAWEDFLPAVKLLFRGRSTLTFEFLAQLVSALLQIFLQFLLLLLEYLGVGRRTFVGFQEAVA